MITLTGTLRQTGEIKKKDSDEIGFVKLWVEVEDERDLKIHEIMLPPDKVGKLPSKGSLISIDGRMYAMGRDLRFAASYVRSKALSPETPLEALTGHSGAK
jgi:hypothetical protein